MKYSSLTRLISLSLAIFLLCAWLLIYMRDYLVYEKAMLSFGVFIVLAFGVLGALYSLFMKAVKEELTKLKRDSKS